jgi:hypothetical protein
MRKSLLVSFVLFLVITAKAQNGFVFNCAQDVVLSCAQSCVTLKANVPDIRSSTADYAVNSISAGGCFRPPVPPDLPGNSTNLEDDDTYTPEIPLPFDFPFYGIIYASLIASTNGIICFDVAEAENFSHYAMLSSGAGLSATGTGGGVDLPDTRYDRALIMGIYEDINPFYPTSPYKQIKYDVIGTAPHRKWILSFYKIPTYSAACQNQIENTYQITLFEGLGLVEVHVFGREKCTGWNQGRAMIGMQNYDRDKGIMPPGRAASTNPLWGSTVMNEAWRFIPNDGPTLFKRVELLDINGNIVATGSTENIGNNTLEASFPNICPPGVGTTSYIVRSVYSKFDDPGVEVYGLDTINVTKNAVASPIQETIVPAVCGTNPTGTITITSPVGPDYIYSIDGGTDFQSSPVFTVAPGSYTIIATDNSSGCSSTKDVIVTSPSTLTATAVSTNTSCPEAANGTITVTATQGTPGYTYALDSTTTYGASNTFTGVTAGPHTVFVTDNAGCVFSFSQDVNSDVSFTTTAVSTDASCVGVANGIITVSQPALGVPPFQYSITGLIALQNSPVLIGLKGDTSYNIRVVDANGCSYSFDQAVANGNGVNATFVSINSACSGVNTGQIVITPTAGTGPFTYSIDGGTTYPSLDTIRNLASGSYSIKVKDDVGCVYDAPPVTVGDDPGVNATFVAINSACLGASTGQIVITPTAGTGPFTYSIDGGTTYPSLDTIRNLASGSYSIKVKDDVGCVYDAPPVTVGDDPGVNATFVSINSACLGVSTGQIVITPTAGTGPFTYSIDGGTTYPSLDTIRNLASGSYSIKVKDDVGCVYDAPPVTVGDDPGVNATFVSINSACSGVSTGQIVITPTAGTGPFTYSIDGGTTYPSLDTIRNLASGSYSIKVKDDVGCV